MGRNQDRGPEGSVQTGLEDPSLHETQLIERHSLGRNQLNYISQLYYIIKPNSLSTRRKRPTHINM